MMFQCCKLPSSYDCKRFLKVEGSSFPYSCKSFCNCKDSFYVSRFAYCFLQRYFVITKGERIMYICWRHERNVRGRF
jgi:hypothetical protein